MKPISEMTLSQIAYEITGDAYICEYAGNVLNNSAIASRLRTIHDLTRWIPVSERMPTEGDGDSRGLVFVWHDTTNPKMKGHGYVAHWHWVSANDEGITHWKRITPPEGA